MKMDVLKRSEAKLCEYWHLKKNVGNSQKMTRCLNILHYLFDFNSKSMSLLPSDLASELQAIKAVKDAPEQWHWLQQQCPAKYVPRHCKCLWKYKGTGNQVRKCCIPANCNQSNSDPNSKAITRWHFVHRAHTGNLYRSRMVMVGAHEDGRNVTHWFWSIFAKQRKTKQTLTSDLWKTVVFADAWILTLPCSRTKRVPTVLPCWTTVSPAKSKRRSLSKSGRCQRMTLLTTKIVDIQSQLGNLFNCPNPLP